MLIRIKAIFIVFSFALFPSYFFLNALKIRMFYVTKQKREMERSPYRRWLPAFTFVPYFFKKYWLIDDELIPSKPRTIVVIRRAIFVRLAISDMSIRNLDIWLLQFSFILYNWNYIYCCKLLGYHSNFCNKTNKSF